MPRRSVAILVLGAIATLLMGTAPDLCHAEDAGCQTDANHHTDLNCHCSCHMAVALAESPAATLERPVARVILFAASAAPSLSPARLDRPPRH
jgi:hypothetical protein